MSDPLSNLKSLIFRRLSQLEMDTHEEVEPSVAAVSEVMREVINSEEFEAELNRVVLGAVGGLMAKISNNAKELYIETVTQNKIMPEKFEVLAITAPEKQSSADILMGVPEKRKEFFFTSDFLQNFPEYMRFLHLGCVKRNN